MNDAAQAEATADHAATVTLTHRGFALTVPAVLDDVDARFLVAFEDGRATAALRYIIGTDEWDRITADGAFTVADFKAISDQLAVLYGFESPGE